MTLDVDVVVPVYNEERGLTRSVEALARYLTKEFPFSAQITIADNGSTDRTWQIAQSLAAAIPGVRAIHLETKGRGLALKTSWLASLARVVVYMDVDLSTDLGALAPLVAPLLSGHSDLAIGSRLLPTSQVERGPKREVISRCYNLLLRAGLSARFSDAQCGFKAIRAECARDLLPLVEDDNWFFDTELLVLAERSGLRIFEVPVDWTDDPDSRVDIVKTASEDLRGMARMRRRFARGALPIAQLRAGIGRLHHTSGALIGQLLRFAVVGIISTGLYLMLYQLMRGFCGAQGANAVALAISAVANTAMNRSVTFGIRGAHHRLLHQSQGLIVFALALAITSGSLALLHLAATTPSVWIETLVLCAANVIATGIRFVLLRQWVFADAGVRS